ncbi:MAG: tetratricopeptide repeat protein [Bacteroidales bacterium]
MAAPRTALSLFITLSVIVLAGCGSKESRTKVEATLPSDSTSISVLNQMIRDNPTNPELFTRRARIYALRKNFAQALNDQTIALSLDSLKPEYYINQAEYFIMEGQPNSAKKALTASLARMPNNTDVMLKLAEVHFYLQEYGLAKIVLRDVATLDNNLAQMYFLQGMISLETIDTVGAIRNFQMAISKEPDFYAAYIQAGKIFSARNDDLAIHYYQSAIDLEPVSYEARYLLGLYYQDHGYLDEAHQQYEFIIQTIDSTQAPPYYNRGYIEMVYRNDFKNAIRWFTLAIEKDPLYADAWYNRGFSHELNGDLKEARADYQQAMELKPNFPLAIKGLNRIDDKKPLR